MVPCNVFSTNYSRHIFISKCHEQLNRKLSINKTQLLISLLYVTYLNLHLCIYGLKCSSPFVGVGNFKVGSFSINVSFLSDSKEDLKHPAVEKKWKERKGRGWVDKKVPFTFPPLWGDFCATVAIEK